MKRNGNVNSNRTFNPKNTKPEVPLDVDEVDAVLAKFIKQKYDQQIFSAGHVRAPAMRTDTGNTSSTRSSEDQPPPLPPKPGKRFGFGLRSVSSALPLSRDHRASPSQSPQLSNGGFEDPIRVNKQSRVFGASVGGGGNENIEAKLAQLRDMGFGDDRRNLNVLKGCGGNLERTIESLVRLGEGSNPTSRSRTPASTRNVAVSQPLPSSSQSGGVVNGISFESRAAAVSETNTASTAPPSNQSPTPFSGQPLPTQPSAQARSFSVGNPYQNQSQQVSFNPFDMPASQQQQSASSTPLDQAFQGMQISQQSEQPPLFPNATGGYPNFPPHAQDPRLQTMTPPISQISQDSNQSNPYAQQIQPANNTQNPFYNSTQQAQMAPPNPYQSNIQSSQPQIFSQSYNPFGQQPVQQSQPNGYHSPQMYSPMTQQGGWGQSQPQSPQVQQGSFSNTQSPQLQQGAFSQVQPSQIQPSQARQGSFQQQPVTQNPYLSQQLQQQQQQQQQPQQNQQQQAYFSPQHTLASPVQPGMQDQSQSLQQMAQGQNPYQTMPLQPQQTSRFGKNDILALYNYPQLAPPLPQSNSNTFQDNGAQQQQQQSLEPPPGPTLSPGRRSATMPALFPSGSNNPFGFSSPKQQPNGLSSTTAGAYGIKRDVNQETVDVGGIQNGRHSPDAFASLSASFAH